MRKVSRLCLLLPAVACLDAAITEIRVEGSSNVQSVLSYRSPVDAACTIAVSGSADFRTIVHDVNPALFPGANADSRAPLSAGRSRVFVAGRRAVERAADGKWYSRALEANRLHYFRIRCGADTATGTFRTANVPAGATYPWPIPQDPASGNFRWPSTDTADRSQTIIDPNYGTVIRRVSIPGDAPGLELPKVTFATVGGANWRAAARGRRAATSSGTRDWLIFTNAGISISPAYLFGSAVHSVVVRVTGSAQGSSAGERTIEVCLTIDGATCHGATRETQLGTSTSVRSLGSAGAFDTWGEALWAHDISGNRSFGVMVRPSQADAAPVTVQSAELDLTLSEQAGFPESGNYRTCASVKSNGGYHCSYPGSGGNGANYLFWIHPDTGESRWLGAIIARGWGGRDVSCLSTNALWDTTDPNVYYCQGTLNDQPVLLRGTYRGNDVAAQPGAVANMTWLNLTSGTAIPDLIKGFDASYDPAAYNCLLSDITAGHAVFRCMRSVQDSIGWLAVFNLASRRIVAASRSFAAPNSRWCGLHAVEPLDSSLNWTGWTAVPLRGGPAGFGPYNVTLQSALPAATGTFTIQVSGEPAPALMDAAAGDLFQINTGRSGFDLLRIVRKDSPRQWVVERTVAFTTATERASGDQLSAFCNAYRTDDPTVAASVYWNFLEDPRSQDTSNQKWVVERVLTGAHLVQRGNYRLQSAWEVVTPGAPRSWNQPISYRLRSNPLWAGTQVGVNAATLPNIYQSHPSYENYRAPDAARAAWFVDLLPFIGGPSLTSSVAAVPGTSQVYKVTGAALHRDIAPTFALCGGRQLRDLSPGPIRDTDSYSYCVGAGCAAGAAPADVYVSCPAPVGPSSRCSGSFAGDAGSVCVADLTPFGQSIVQVFFEAGGARNRVLSNGLFPWHSARTGMSLATASPLPDGSWIAFASHANNARRDIYLLQVPPAPATPDGAEALVPLTIPLTAPATPGIERVVIQYGSSERLGAATAPAACLSGSACSGALSYRPFDVLYYRAVFQDASGRVIAEGPIQVRLSGGVPGANLDRPKITPARVVNSASFERKIAPGAIVSIFGENLANCQAEVGQFPLPTSLCDSSVTFNGAPAGYFFANPTQINVQAPAALVPRAEVEVVVARNGMRSDPERVPAAAVDAVAPAIFSYALEDGKPRAIIHNADNSLNGPANPEAFIRPLKAGETAVVYVSGLGATTPPVPDREPGPVDPPARVAAPVDVLINDVSQRVLFAGLVPLLAGFYQVNFVLDPGTPIDPNDGNQIAIAAAGQRSPSLAVSLAPAELATSP